MLPIALFGLSRGLRDLFLTAASPAAESLALSFAGGAALGLLFGAVSFGLRRWPGGYLAATALQFTPPLTYWSSVLPIWVPRSLCPDIRT